MCKFMKQSLSILLALVLVINLLPLNVLSIGTSISVEEDDNTVTTVTTPYERSSTAKIVEEDTSKRSEYYKEFVLNNGLRMETVYPYAVHYEQDGKWEEIDNTLKVSGSSYVNTAGKWAVSFPQKLSNNNAVTIQKDGYTLSFYMAGELRSSNTGNLERASLAGVGTAETFSVQSMQTASAQIDTIDLSNMKSAMEHPEIIPEKNQSRLQYSNVYNGTNVVYDLSSNRVKESIIMQSYSANLRGYRYSLNVGELRPVLDDSGEIFLYDRTGEEVVMVMPAPFLVDDVGEYCYDVTVSLAGNGSNYTLTYLLPQDWLADSQRQWPVVLDPMVDADITRSNIRDVSVYERYGSSNNNAGLLDIGHDPTYGITRAYLKYNNLPALTSADVVVDAKLTMYKYSVGHKISDGRFKRADFVNPDVLASLYDKMARRPIVSDIRFDPEVIEINENVVIEDVPHVLAKVPCNGQRLRVVIRKNENHDQGVVKISAEEGCGEIVGTSKQSVVPFRTLDEVNVLYDYWKSYSRAIEKRQERMKEIGESTQKQG